MNMHKKIYPLVFLLVCFAPLYTHATVLKVTSLADAGAGTLRDQINLANAGDTVLIDVKGTINLNSQINVPGGKNVTVIGPYPIHCTINVSAVAFGSAFDVATGATFNLMGVAIKGSTSGANGYFISDGNCLIRDCLFESNTSSANGGAINNSFNGFIRVENSSFIDNTLAAGSSGGAIFNNNDMVLVNCTFYGNSATTGGAIFNNTATASLELLHCTFDNNQAYGGVGNGNAIYNNGGTVGIQNCIVVHSGAGAAFADMFGSSGGTWTSHGGNIIRRNPGGFLSASGSDITNSTFSSVDPNFRTGGPLTDGYGLKYLKINPGSNAIDKGIIPGVASAIPPIDCRRAPRTIHGGSSLMPDAGAVEYTAYTVTSAAGFTTQWAAMIASIVPGPRYMDFDHIGPITIPVGSAFTFAATEPWMIDGYSQPGTAVP
ncbi:MAG TPA: right-handed parallel beta-helix repeat-containing protein, partial [Flavobacteriales bacterium]|nr:right-handed parallel beta-helix repeat-containing protein [Flavobacteriales bacterium]